MLKKNFYKIIITGMILSGVLIIQPQISAANNDVIEIKKLELNSPEVRSIREDIRTTIYTIMSGRPVDELPELKIYSYRPQKGDTFWNILSKTSLDLDTLLTLNALNSPSDISDRNVIYLSNMRGIAVQGKNSNEIQRIIFENNIDSDYVKKANRSNDLSKDYIFIPGARISSLERSLFLGTAFVYPVKNGRKSSGFGQRANPFDRTKREFHTGIDIAVPLRTEVYASRAGVVEFSGYKGGYGLLVIIRHEHGYRTYYGHLSRSNVKKGERVAANQVVALSGNTGRTTGPHVHFEIRKGDQPIDPSRLLRR